MTQQEPLIHLREANIAIHDILILKGVNLTVYPGEFKYLIGKTGTGKSSLIKTLYGELPLKSGQGVVAGHDLIRLRTKQIPFLRRKLGIVFQDFHLLMDRSIHDNLMFVLKATGWRDRKLAEGRIAEVFESVGLQTKGFKRPHQLSGGEQQRVVIARALLNDPEIILADEPTGNLDPQTSAEIMNLMKEINNRGKAIFMATHNYNLIRKFPSPVLKCENSALIPDDTILQSFSD
ncbi:MAG: ATP-binding cassette domain-containing protein [Bacteroidales bacterium]